MKKLASPEELTSELRSLLAYAEGDQPSREKLASDLNGLADRVAGRRAPWATNIYIRDFEALEKPADQLSEGLQDLLLAVGNLIHAGDLDDGELRDLKKLGDLVGQTQSGISRVQSQIDRLL